MRAAKADANQPAIVAVGSTIEASKMIDNEEVRRTGLPPAPQEQVKPPRRWAAYPLPLDDGFMAQVVLPLDLSPSEAKRLQQFIAALVVPWRVP